MVVWERKILAVRMEDVHIEGVRQRQVSGI